MAESTIVQKLRLKPGNQFLLIDPPAGYQEALADLPAEVTVLIEAEHPVDVIQVFVQSQADLESGLTGWKALLKPKGILWVTYPKGTSKMHADLNRDTIWRFAQTVGMDAVAVFAVDQDWSAMRLKHA